MRRAFVAAVAPSLALLAAARAFAQTAADRDAMWHMGWGWGWGGMLFGTLTMLVFVAGIVVLAVLLARWLGGGPSGREPPAARRTALEILQERFAKGEIDKQEYEERRRVLKGEG